MHFAITEKLTTDWGCLHDARRAGSTCWLDEQSGVFHHLTVTIPSLPNSAHATPLFPYLALIYAYWYTRTYQSLTAVVLRQALGLPSRFYAVVYR